MQKLAANLTEKMLRRKLISPEQAEWCAYLVECKLEQMLCFSVLIALGCLIAPLWEVLLLNWGVVFLRRKANGLHLHTFWGCMLSSLFCELTALWACEKVTPAVAVLLLTISLLTLCLAAPVNDVNIHFDSDEMQALRGGMQKRLAVYTEKEMLKSPFDRNTAIGQVEKNCMSYPELALGVTVPIAIRGRSLEQMANDDILKILRLQFGILMAEEGVRGIRNQ